MIYNINMNNKCTNPNGHQFIPIEWVESVIPPLHPGNISEIEKVYIKQVGELMCIYCEQFRRINRK